MICWCLVFSSLKENCKTIICWTILLIFCFTSQKSTILKISKNSRLKGIGTVKESNREQSVSTQTRGNRLKYGAKRGTKVSGFHLIASHRRFQFILWVRIFLLVFQASRGKLLSLFSLRTALAYSVNDPDHQTPTFHLVVINPVNQVLISKRKKQTFYLNPVYRLNRIKIITLFNPPQISRLLQRSSEHLLLWLPSRGEHKSPFSSVS